MELNENVQYIKGVGENRAKLLNKLGIYTLNDLISYYPRYHEDRSKIKKIVELEDCMEGLIEVIVISKMQVENGTSTGVTDANCYLAQKCAVAAMKFPTTVSTIS